MPKAIVSISGTQVVGNDAYIGYMVSVIQTSVVNPFSFGSDYKVNTAITLNNNLIVWRNKIIAQVSEKGETIIASDVIIFGGPI